MNKVVKFFISVTICELAGLLATPFTITSISTWYTTLEKPALTPPDWIFAPVWITLYFMMGVSLFLVWSKNTNESQMKLKSLGIKLFSIQLGLNFLWSLLFFGMQNPALAGFEIIALLITISYTLLVFKNLSKSAAYLLVPYILWVAFASYLNIAILVLNPRP